MISYLTKKKKIQKKTKNKNKANKKKKKNTFLDILFERLVPFFGILLIKKNFKKIINLKTVYSYCQ